MDGYVHRSPPPAAFWFPGRRGQRALAPQGETLSLEREPPEKQAGGSETRPYDISGKIQQNRTTGAHCAPLRRLRQDTAKQGGPPGPPSFILLCRKTASEIPATAQPR